MTTQSEKEWVKVDIFSMTKDEAAQFIEDKAYFNPKKIVFNRLMRIFVAGMIAPYIKMSIKG